MADVKRLYVEKKSGFNIEAKHAFNDFYENLNMKNLAGVRILNRYDVEGLSGADFDGTLHTVFSEPPVDDLYIGEFPVSAGERVFAVEYLPGQYDQRADSAAQCVQLLTLKNRPEVRTAKVYVLSGALSEADVKKIKDYVINPVDSREAELAKPETLLMELPEPEDIAVVRGFTAWSEREIEAYRQENGFAMSTQDMLFTQGYFRDEEKRDPTITELRVIDTYWSDHCRHTTFLTRLNNIRFSDGTEAVYNAFEEYLEARKTVYGEREKDVNLMDVATLYAKEAKKKGLLKGVDVSDEINACTIKEKVKIDGREEDYLILFKNETHNHPTEIEPFGGAATCLGGAIRDPLSGRAYVYQAMRVTGAADPRERVEDTLPHKLPQKKITVEAAHGYSSYGNQIGLATGIVHEIYHPGYKAKRMEIGAVVGAAPAGHVKREKPVPGDAVLLIGGRTGRDGCGGATGSSKAHDEKSIVSCGAEVQKGNPLTERKLQRLFRKEEFAGLVKKCNDFGAGGVCVAIGELSDGLDVDLDKVLKKYEGLDGTELAISESQERMAVVVDEKDIDAVLNLAGLENLEATRVATVTDTGRMRLYWRGKPIVDIKREFLDTNGATQEADALIGKAELKDAFLEKTSGDFKTDVKDLLLDLGCCSQDGLVERFDATIGASTVLMPYGGLHRSTPAQAMAAKVPVLNGKCDTATVMAFGSDPYLSERSAFHGAVYAVLHSVAKLAAAGADTRRAYLTLQEYFERLGEDEAKWGKPLSALLGAFTAERGMGIAAIGGKDSMSGTFMDISVPSTLVSFAVAAVDAGDIVSPELKGPGSRILLLDIRRDADMLPDFDDVKEKYALLRQAVAGKKIHAAYAVDRGGIVTALAKMAFGNRVGVEIDSGLTLLELTEKKYGAILVEAAEALPGFAEIGRTVSEAFITYGNERISLDEAYEAYTKPLKSVFPTRAGFGEKLEDRPLYTGRSALRPKIKTASPKVVIPVFPGTNCEYDSARAFSDAGARPEVVLVRNLTAQDIEDSIVRLKNSIKDAQIVMIPGGFSGGDEPDGSGKFIATVFRNPYIAEAVMDLLNKRDGLMLGVCNGFQALIKLGLVPYGEIRDLKPDSPTLTFNTIGRHVSAMVHTRVASVKSPWLMECGAGEVHTVAVSHGEGRFVATKEEIESLFMNGQVATQYTDPAGNPSMDGAYNPNGSLSAIEGITSPDGRIFGKMAHSERYHEGLLINVPGEKDQKIFASGVKYFL
jgi:phosphoribosylformylglycinamidine synthase